MSEPGTNTNLWPGDATEHVTLLRRQVEAVERAAADLHTIKTILLVFFIAAAVVVGLYAAALFIGFFII